MSRELNPKAGIFAKIESHVEILDPPRWTLRGLSLDTANHERAGVDPGCTAKQFRRLTPGRQMQYETPVAVEYRFA
jgi:hypothetical protein